MDHANLRYILNPDATTSKTTLKRLERRALLIQASRYTIRHIAGEDNVAADLWSRWGCPSSNVRQSRMLKNLQNYLKVAEKHQTKHPEGRKKGSKKESTKEKKLKAPKRGKISKEETKENEYSDYIVRTDPIMSIDGKELQLPSLKEINDLQKRTTESPPKNTKMENGVLTTRDGKIWVPREMVPIITAVIHIALGHTGQKATQREISKKYYSKHFKKYLEILSKYCLICLPERMPTTIRRQLGEQKRAVARSEILHADFLYIEKELYVLVIRDDLSGKVELY
mmetsp:Transcript_36419/g.45514  ORF Transcript_36419/g.45514 Transcript_36419/m.45514 type:complete len:283 (-) Transcript_36419:1612-2460(-)